MALVYQRETGQTGSFAIWKIEETAEELLSQLQLREHETSYLDTLVNGKRNLHWLSTRVLLRRMMNTDEYIDCQIDNSGKPYLTNFPHFISLSHSFDYAAVMISRDHPVGIDIELVKEKIERIRNKFMSPTELSFINPDTRIEHLYVCWCAKEAIYKLHGKKNVSFLDNIKLLPFEYYESGGAFTGMLEIGDYHKLFKVHYDKFDGYMIGYVSDGEEDMKNKEVIFQDWGLVDYEESWQRQEEIFSETVQAKIMNRKQETGHPIKNHLVFVEHPHVYTLGNSGKPENLLLDEDGLKNNEATYYKINRGGDITYHGPGQLVGYPILDLENFFTDIHLYLRTLEEAVILLLADYGIKGGRYPGFTGVWIDADNARARKICAMGVRCSRWVTMHGFALNVNTGLNYFDHIIPCGIDDKDVTSVERELGKQVDMEEVKDRLKGHIFQQFGMTLQNS